MRILIAIVAGVVAGLGVRTLTSPTIKEITAPAPAYAETHAQTVQMAEAKQAALKRESEPPLNPAYPEMLTVRGYITKGQRINVVLSDGTTWTEKNLELDRVERNYVVFAGKTYALVTPSGVTTLPVANQGTGAPLGFNDQKTSGPAYRGQQAPHW